MGDAHRGWRWPASAGTWRVLAALEAGKGCVALTAAIMAATGPWQWPVHALQAFDHVEHWSGGSWRLVLWGAAGYAASRFVEAVGLWRARSWARWFAIAGYVAYIPLELWALAHQARWWMPAALALNVAVVALLVLHRAPSDARAFAPTSATTGSAGDEEIGQDMLKVVE
jgi:uncharacterized membrane protein (DUF2068 family)